MRSLKTVAIAATAALVLGVGGISAASAQTRRRRFPTAAVSMVEVSKAADSVAQRSRAAASAVADSTAAGAGGGLAWPRIRPGDRGRRRARRVRDGPILGPAMDTSGCDPDDCRLR